MSGSNPLVSRKKSTPLGKDHPALMHAQAWGRVQQIPPENINAQTDQLEYVLPVLGALAGNPKVTPKMVIKAAAQASADGKIEPSDAVKFISGMPPDPQKLQGWLRDLYTHTMSAQVHLKAAQIKAAQPPPQPPQQAAPAPASPLSTPTAMTPGVSPLG